MRPIDVRAKVLEEFVRFRQVFAVRAFALEEVRDGVKAEGIDAHVEPEVGYVFHGLTNVGVIEV